MSTIARSLHKAAPESGGGVVGLPADGALSCTQPAVGVVSVPTPKKRASYLGPASHVKLKYDADDGVYSQPQKDGGGGAGEDEGDIDEGDIAEGRAAITLGDAMPSVRFSVDNPGRRHLLHSSPSFARGFRAAPQLPPPDDETGATATTGGALKAARDVAESEAADEDEARDP
jgi:hypothetical protein